MTTDSAEEAPKVGWRPNVWRRLKGIPPRPEAEGKEGDVPESWEGKGDILHDAAKLSEALECYTKGLTEDPKRLNLWMKKADIFLDMKRYRSGLFCIEQALKLEMSEPDIWLIRGILQHRAGDNTGAIASLNYSLSLKTDRPETWAVKGAALLAEDRIDEARTCLEHAIDMDSENPEVEALAQALGKMVEEAKRCPICHELTKDGRCERCISKVAIDDARIVIAKAREAEKEVTEAEGLMDEAKNFHEKGFFSQAIKVLRPLEKILAAEWLNGAYMASIAEEAEEIALSLEADNMIGTRLIRERIARANEEQERDRPLKAVVKAREALDLANKIARKYSDLLLKTPEKKKKKQLDEGIPTCPSCGEEVEDSWVKCPVCKATLKEEAASVDAPPIPGPTPVQAPAQGPPAEAGVKYCPKCGEEVEDFWVKCLFCDASLTGGGGG